MLGSGQGPSLCGNEGLGVSMSSIEFGGSETEAERNR